MRRTDVSILVVLGLASVADTALAQRTRASETAVVLEVPGMDRVERRAALPFQAGDGSTLFYDAYLPERETGERFPAIVFVSGTDSARHWLWYQSYGRLAAAQGFVGIIPDKRYQRSFDAVRNGYADTRRVLDELHERTHDLTIDPDRVCVWVFSGGGYMASAVLPPDAGVRCLVIYYGILDGTSFVQEQLPANERADALRRYSPLHVLESLDQIPPLFIARAGRDNATLNESIDRFAALALERNAPITVINYAAGDHGFDGWNDTDRSREILRATFDFIRQSTRPGGSD